MRLGWIAMRRLWLIALFVLAAAGCGSTETVTVTTTRTVTTAPAAKKTVRVYFMRDGKVAPVARELQTADRASLLAAVGAGPTDR
jgi:hypothetical protein